MQTMNEKLNHDEVLRGSPSGKEATSLLGDFILRVLRFEEMHRLSSKLISGYQQELEKLRRPPLDKSSSMLKDLLKSIPSSRMARYQEADCHHAHSDQQSLAKLNMYTNGLREHISGAQSIVEHLEKLVEKVTGLMDADLHLLTTENELENTHLDESSDGVEQVPCPGEPNAASWRTSDFAILMSSILSMLEKDLQMQALVVADLSLDVDSDRLQTYAQMWSLRPFVDDALLHQALGWSYK
eukprot:c22499_g1_i2 orf=197-919(+)